jgi:hypothetical protein
MIGRQLSFESIGTHLPHEIFANHLFHKAKISAWLRGLSFDSEVSANMELMAKLGAVKLLSLAKGKPPEEAKRFIRAGMRVGSEAMVVFVDEMASEWLIIPDYGPELHDDIWTKVYSTLCPVWLFC